jgi:hypothetical protein
MSTPTATGFDLAVLKDAIERSDAAGQLALYAPDAEVRLVDRITTPGRPRVLRGREEIAGWMRMSAAGTRPTASTTRSSARAALHPPSPAATRTARTCSA